MLKPVSTIAIVTLLGVGARMVPAQQCCGDCNGNGQVSIDEIIKAVNRALDGCQNDHVCSASGGQHVPASGQLTSYGPGSDGDVRAGVALSYTDNGDGTITDNTTGLMWEKKDDSGGLHDKDNTYTWGMTAAPFTMNGTMVTDLLSALNTPPCFAGYCDWRIPNAKELQTLVDYEVPAPGPTISTAFHNPSGCKSCTDLTAAGCSCTAPTGYWTSTTSRNLPGYAWRVSFRYGLVGNDDDKGYAYAVRAVRGGM